MRDREAELRGSYDTSVGRTARRTAARRRRPPGRRPAAGAAAAVTAESPGHQSDVASDPAAGTGRLSRAMSSDMRPTMTADELRAAWTEFFAARGAHRGASAQPDPDASVGPDVHQLGHDAVRAVLPRRGAGAVRAAPGGLGPEVRARRRQAQRPGCHRSFAATPVVLRDARQLQLRRLLQGRGDPVGVGVRHRGAGHRRRPSLGHLPRVATTRPRRSGPTWWACPGSASSASTRTTSGRWARPGPCGPSSELFYDHGPEHGPGRWPGQRGAPRTASSRSGTWSSRSTSATADGR